MKKKNYIIIALSSLAFASCAQVVPSYQVTNSGPDWPNGETRTILAKDVQPNLQLPDELGGGTIPLPPIEYQK